MNSKKPNEPNKLKQLNKLNKLNESPYVSMNLHLSPRVSTYLNESPSISTGLYISQSVSIYLNKFNKPNELNKLKSCGPAVALI